MGVALSQQVGRFTRGTRRDFGLRQVGAWLLCAVGLAAGAVAADTTALPQEPSERPESARPWGPTGSWGIGEHDASLQVLSQDVDRVHKRSREASEVWTVVLGDGSFANLEHIIPKSYVLPDLKASLWVRADDSPLQFKVRVVLPQSGTHGGPLTAWLEGDAPYTEAGEWQQLTASDLPRKLKRQVRVLRHKWGSQVSTSGAYVDRVAVNIYSGKGRLKVWLDDLGLEGSVEIPSNPRSDYVQLASATSVADPEPVQTSAEGVSLRGSVWMAGGRPFFPRIIDLRSNGQNAGGPSAIEWPEISERRWNTVWQGGDQLETDLRLADTHRLWLIAEAPPPDSPWLTLSSTAPILAWHVPPTDPASPSRTTWTHLQRLPTESRRPVILSEETPGLRPLSWELILRQRVAWGSSFSLARWPEWLVSSTSQSVTSPPFLVTLDTGPPPSALQQARRVGLDGPTPCVSFEALRQLTRWSILSGARGIVSDLVLEPGNQLTRQRALDLWELLNLELELLDPWLTSDQPRQRIRTSLPEINYLYMQNDRAAVAVPLLPLQGIEHVAPLWRDVSLTVKLPDHSPSAVAYEVAGDRLRPLPAKHVPGGLQVEIGKFLPSNLILVTSKEIAVDHTRKQLVLQARRRLDLWARLFRDEVQRVDATAKPLQPVLLEPQTVSRWLRAAAEFGAQADEARAQGDHTAAMRQYELATAALSRGQRAAWTMITESLPQPTSSPGGILFDTLPAHLALLKRLEHTNLGPELLPAGDLEDLEQLSRAGWQHWQTLGPPQLASVTLHGESPRYGQRCVGMQVMAPGTDGRAIVGSRDTINPPWLWVQSPAIPQTSDGLLLIHGWFRIRRAVAGNEGLLIYDSIGGPALGLRHYDEGDWQEFAMYRMAQAGETVQLTIALTAPGQVDLDQISMTRVGP